MAWKALSQMISQAIRIVVLVALALLLTPSDYGLAGMALAFAALASVLLDPGLAAAIVQRPALRPIETSTAHWTSTAIGVLLAAAGLIAAPAIGAFYGQSEVTQLFAALSLAFAVTGFGVVPTALLTRAQAFRELEVARISGVVVGSVLAIAVAAAGGGAWAIIAQQLALAVTTTALVWLLTPTRPVGGFSRTAFRDLGSFGARLLGSRLLVYANRTADNLLVGRVLGARALGLYSLAYNVILVPFAGIVDPVREVLFPIFARLQGDVKRLGSIWLRVNRVLAAIFAPAMLGFVVIAPDLIPTVLGNRWAAAVPAARVLALVGLVQILLPLNPLVLTVLDRTKSVLRLAWLGAIASVAGFVAGLPWGITGVSVGYLLANLLVVPVNVLVTTRVLDLPLLALPKAVQGVAEAAFGMALIAAACRFALVSAGVGPWARLPLVIGVGVLGYAALARWRTKDVFAEARLLWSLARDAVQ